MANMSYCRFYNTYHDLVDCKNALYNGDIESLEEKKYAKKLIELCKEIAEDYSPEDIAKEFDDEMKEGAEKYFKGSMQYCLSSSSSLKLLGTSKS